MAAPPVLVMYEYASSPAAMEARASLLIFNGSVLRRPATATAPLPHTKPQYLRKIASPLSPILGLA